MGSQAGSSSQGTALEQGKASVDVLPIATDTTVNGAGIDRQGYSAALIVAQAGAATGTPTAQTFDAKLQHSADNVTYADAVAATGLTVAITQMTADSQVAELGGALESLNRYIRTQITVALTGGSTPKWPIAVATVLTGADRNPA